MTTLNRIEESVHKLAVEVSTHTLAILQANFTIQNLVYSCLCHPENQDGGLWLAKFLLSRSEKALSARRRREGNEGKGEVIVRHR